MLSLCFIFHMMCLYTFACDGQILFLQTWPGIIRRRRCGHAARRKVEPWIWSRHCLGRGFVIQLLLDEKQHPRTKFLETGLHRLSIFMTIIVLIMTLENMACEHARQSDWSQLLRQEAYCVYDKQCLLLEAVTLRDLVTISSGHRFMRMAHFYQECVDDKGWNCSSILG